MALISLAELVMFTLAVYAGVYLYYLHLLGMSSAFVVLFFAIAVELLRVSVRQLLAIYDSRETYRQGKTEPHFIGEMVLGLCEQRKIRIPHIVIRYSEPRSNWIPAGILDTLLLNSILYLDAELVWCFPRAELRAIIAHELRHHNASTNTMRAVIMAIVEIWKRVWFYYVAFAGIWILVRGAPLFGLSVSIAGLIFGAVFLGLSNSLIGYLYRLEEFKTDILSAYDIGAPSALVYGLERLERYGPGAYQLIEQESRSSDSLRFRARLQKLLFVAYYWVVRPRSTHPTTSARREMLARIFGSIPECPNPEMEAERGYPLLNGGVFIIFELSDD